MEFSEIYDDYKMNQMPLNVFMSYSIKYFKSLYRVTGIEYLNQRKQK